MVDAPQMIGNIPVGKVMQGVSQTANAALNQDPLVRVGTAPGRKISPEDSDVVIRIPTTPPPPSPKVINEPWHREGCIAISEALEGAQDFTAQLRGNTLIGIHEEHPFLGRLGMRKGFLIPVSSPGALENPVRILPADLYGTVGTERIHHDDLIAPPQAFETGPDVFLLVEADNDGRDFWTSPNHFSSL